MTWTFSPEAHSRQNSSRQQRKFRVDLSRNPKLYHISLESWLTLSDLPTHLIVRLLRQANEHITIMSSIFASLNTSKPPAATAGLFGSLGTPTSSGPQSNDAGTMGGGRSLFDRVTVPAQPATTNPGGVGLFGSLGTTTSQPTTTEGGGLFGRVTAPAQPATSSAGGGMIGNLNTPTSQPTGTGLFGSLGTSTNTSQPQQQSGGLFASLGAGTQQQQPTGGLFGRVTNPTDTTQSQQQGGELFGGLGATSQAQSTQPQQASSLFGGLGASNQPQQQQQQVQNTGNSIIGSTSVGNGASVLGQSAQNGPSGAPYFDAILEKSRKRAHDEDSLGLQLGLGDIRQRMRRIGSTPEDEVADGRAHYLLAASGIDPGAAVRDLNFFSTPSIKIEREAAQDTADADVEGYLSNIQTQTTMSMIADGLARSTRDFDDFLEENVTMEWEAQRKRIYEHFGIKQREALAGSRGGTGMSEWKGTFGRSRRGQGATVRRSEGPQTPGRSTLGRSSMHRSVIGAAGPVGQPNPPLFAETMRSGDLSTAMGPSDRLQREKQGRYIERVQDLNQSRLKKRKHPVLHDFADVVRNISEQHAQDVENAYQALIEIVGETSDPELMQSVPTMKERYFAQGHLDENVNAKEKVELRKHIINGSAAYLENSFYQEMELLVMKNAKEANLGGIPDRISVVKAYIRIRAAQKDLVPDNTDLQTLGDDYVWALLFYLLRSGHITEAVKYVEDNAVAFRAIDTNFMQYIRNYAQDPEKRLRRDLQDRINSAYNQRHRIAPEHSIDPFRMACYKVIGRCDLQKRTIDNLYQQPNDFMWLQFKLAREVKNVNEIASDVYDLSQVQETVREVCERFSNEPGTPGWNMYFFFQVLVGKFENVVDYLYKLHPVEAVHLAIALDYYGLLRVTDPSVNENLLSYTTRNQPQINFGVMVGYYTRDFRAANVGAAVDYLCLICLNQDLPGEAGHQQVSLCHEALRELVLESREFAMLLGDMRSDGTHVKGSIEERIPLIGITNEQGFVRSVTIQAASIADDNGRTTDAILLNHLAGEYNNVINIINRALSEALAIPIGQEPMRLQRSKPRPAESDSQRQTRGQQDDTLSLTAVDDPEDLASNMLRLYQSSQMYREKCKEQDLKACDLLLGMASAKKQVSNGEWSLALDVSILLLLLTPYIS